MTAGSRVIVSREGTLGCLIEPRQVSALRLPLLERDAEVGIDEDADVALVGDPEVLVILARSGRLHVIDHVGKDGPEKVSDLAVDAGSRIISSKGNHILLTTPGGSALVTISGRQASIARLPLRGVIDAGASSATPDHFVISVGGVIEEWSAELRAPLRRFRLERPVTARHMGGNARQIWFVPAPAPSQLIVIPLAGAAPIRIDLPEAASRAVSDSLATRVLTVGAVTGAVFLILLATQTVTMIHPGPMDDAVWCRAHTVLCARGAFVELVELPRMSNEDIARQEPSVAPAMEAGSSVEPPLSTTERLNAWKQRVRVSAEPITVEPANSVDDAPGIVASKSYEVLESITPLHEWRDVIAAWTRRTLAGARSEPPLLAAGPLHDVGTRLGLTSDDAPFFWFVYGARLCGLDGIAPVDLVAVAQRRWDDVLGRTRLASLGVFRWRRNRIDLTPEIAAALDEVAPLSGVIVASAITVERTVAIVAPPLIELMRLGVWAATHVGSVLVANARGIRNPAKFLLEARARGLAPLIRSVQLANEPPPERTVIVVETLESAQQLGISGAMTFTDAKPS